MQLAFGDAMKSEAGDVLPTTWLLYTMKYIDMFCEKLYADASWSINIFSVSPNKRCDSSLSNICRWLMFHSTSCTPYIDFISSKL